jgi:DNA-binding winged helix-turn-helix (wHTH) protein
MFVVMRPVWKREAVEVQTNLIRKILKAHNGEVIEDDRIIQAHWKSRVWGKTFR